MTDISNRIDKLASQHEVLVTTALPTFIAMRHIQAGESILDIKCTNGKILIKIDAAIDKSAKVILRFNENRDLLRSASQLLQSLNLKKFIRLFQASILENDADAITQALSENHLPLTFNTIFAINILPPDTLKRITVLRRLASRLSPNSKRIIVTFKHPHEVLSEITDAVRFDYQNNVHHRTT